MMSRRKRRPVKKSRIEPLFIKFANFKFSGEKLEDFFNILAGLGIEVPLEELFIYYRIDDEEYSNGPSSLTESEKEKIVKDLESAQLKIRSLLMDLGDEKKFGQCLERMNSFCAEAPVRFSLNEENSGRLNFSLPSLRAEDIGWGSFIATLMAVDLGKYLVDNPAQKIKMCKKTDCEKFFIKRWRLEFCSNECKRLFNYIPRRDSGYYRDYMKAGRKEGKYK